MQRNGSRMHIFAQFTPSKPNITQAGERNHISFSCFSISTDMCDSNLQRETILPSERAAAYKMKLEVIKRRAGSPQKSGKKMCLKLRRINALTKLLLNK